VVLTGFAALVTTVAVREGPECGGGGYGYRVTPGPILAVMCLYWTRFHGRTGVEDVIGTKDGSPVRT
jgi:hypothetical protein